MPAGSSATGYAVQKNSKPCRIKLGSGSHPQRPLFSTLDVSTLKAPTGSSFVGQGFCGHYPPHSAGSLLDCVSTTERALTSRNNDEKTSVQMGSGEVINNTRTFIRSVNDNSNLPGGVSNVSPKVKVSQFSVTVRPNCVKAGTPPLSKSSRRTGTVASNSSTVVRKSVSSPEAMSIGGDDTTSSEKGSRSPSPPITSTCSESITSPKKVHEFTKALLDNNSQITTPDKIFQVDNVGVQIKAPSDRITSTTEKQAKTEGEDDNRNGNLIVVDHTAVS